MPTPDNLEPVEISFEGGYFPRAKALRPGAAQYTFRRANNVWLRPGGVVEPAMGPLEISAVNVGARLFAADTQWASIAGDMVGSLLPYAGLIRIDNAVLLYVSEKTSQQVYLDGVAPAGLITSPTPGRLRVAIPTGGGAYSVFDAGFDKPTLIPANVVVNIFGFGAQRPMSGSIGVAIAPWRSKTNAIGPPSDVIFSDVQPVGTALLNIALPSMVSGQDGWIYCGTRWGDQRGPIRIVRYVYTQPRGTFTATNGNANLTAGVGTFWTRDIREGDTVTIDGGSYQIQTVTSDTTATLLTNFTGSTNSGKTMTITNMGANWYDWELGSIVSRDVLRPPPAAGVLKYRGRVFLWGVPDTTRVSTSSATGNAIVAMLDNNPEHVGLFAIGTASGGNLLNVIGGDGPLYLVTTQSLEAVRFTNDPDQPYEIDIIAQPGFRAGTNVCLHEDYVYGFNTGPFRTKAKDNIDVEFAQWVASDMKTWDAARVMLAVDPKPEDNAVLYMYDDGNTTTVRPWMAHQGVWGAPINLAARVLDTAVVNGSLDLTYLSAGNTRVNRWEGGTFIGGTPYASSQYYEARLFGSGATRIRLKNLEPTGKLATLRVYAALPGSRVPDVSNAGAAAASFPLSNIADQSEEEIWTNLEGRALAFRVEFSSADGTFESLIARGRPITERR